MTASADLIALKKTEYFDEISTAYTNKGTLKNLISVGSDVNAEIKQYPLLGILIPTRRYGSEVIQPQQPVTDKVLMTFETWDIPTTLNIIQKHEIDNPDYIPKLVARQANGIVALIEQQIMDGFGLIPTVDANKISPIAISTGYRINGDGTAYTDSSAEAPLTLLGIFKLTEMFEDLGIVMGERYLVVPPYAMYGTNGLLSGADKDRFTSDLYTGDHNLQASNGVYSIMGLKIIVAQGNPNGGLPGTGTSLYGLAFSKETMLANMLIGGDGGSDIWFDNDRRSWVFYHAVRIGVVGQQPATFIKVAIQE